MKGISCNSLKLSENNDNGKIIKRSFLAVCLSMSFGVTTGYAQDINETVRCSSGVCTPIINNGDKISVSDSSAALNLAYDSTGSTYTFSDLTINNSGTDAGYSHAVQVNDGISLILTNSSLTSTSATGLYNSGITSLSNSNVNGSTAIYNNYRARLTVSGSHINSINGSGIMNYGDLSVSDTDITNVLNSSWRSTGFSSAGINLSNNAGKKATLNNVDIYARVDPSDMPNAGSGPLTGIYVFSSVKTDTVLDAPIRILL